jgi:hypothetical protein
MQPTCYTRLIWRGYSFPCSFLDLAEAYVPRRLYTDLTLHKSTTCMFEGEVVSANVDFDPWENVVVF